MESPNQLPNQPLNTQLAQTNALQPRLSPLERLETSVDSMTHAQVENTTVLKGLEPVMEALIHSYVQGTQEIQAAIQSIQQYLSQIEPVTVNQEAVAAIAKLSDTFSNPNLFQIPQPTVIQDSKDTVKAIRDLIKTVDLKPMEVNVENDFTKLEKALGRIEKLVKVEIPLEDGRVAVKLSDADLKKLGEGFSFPIAVGTASEDTLKLIQTQLNKLTFTGSNLNVTGGGGGSAGTEYTEGDIDTTITGTALLWEDTSDTLRVPSAAKPLPVQVISGVTSGLTDTQLRATPVPVSGTFYQTTQPVSASSLPLPSGASTAAKQPALGTAGTPSGDVLTVQGVTSMTALKVDGSAVTQPVSASALPLPSGAATSTKQDIANAVIATKNTANPSVALQIGMTDGTNIQAPQTASNDAVSPWLIAEAAVGFYNGSSVDRARGDITNGLDVDVTRVIPGTSATHLGKAEDAAHTTGDTGVMALAVRNDAGTALAGTTGDYIPLSTDSSGALRVTGGGGGTQYNIDDALTSVATGTVLLAIRDDALSTLTPVEGDANALRVDANGGLWVSLATKLDSTNDSISAVVNAQTTGGATPYQLISAATTNATNVKSSAGQLYMITASNVNASPRYLKIYDKASTPTVGTDTPKFTFIIPGNTAGSGTNIPIPAQGVSFTNGISFALTTGIAVSDTGAVAASELAVNLAYK